MSPVEPASVENRTGESAAMTAAPVTPPDRTCDEVEALLPLIADGSLEVAQDPAVFVHLATCDHCADLLARYDVAALAVEAVLRPPVAKPRLRLLPIRRHRSAIMRWLPLAAAACLVHVAPAAAPVTPVLASAESDRTPMPNRPDIDITVIPGQMPGHQFFLIRQGGVTTVRETLPPGMEHPLSDRGLSDRGLLVPASYNGY